LVLLVGIVLRSECPFQDLFIAISKVVFKEVRGGIEDWLIAWGAEELPTSR
jgi:hypothetical protein